MVSASLVKKGPCNLYTIWTRSLPEAWVATSPSRDQPHTELLDGMPPPRWNRARRIYPSHVHSYLDCPNHCRLQYVERVPFERAWDRKIEVGNALHKVMERVGRFLRDRRAAPPVTGFLSTIEECLPESAYIAMNIDLDERQTDIDNVLAWADAATAYISRGSPTVLNTESTMTRDWQGNDALGEVHIAARADLVIKREDEHGPYIELVDYKSGHWQRELDFTPAITRISQKQQIQNALFGDDFPRVVFTYLWLALGERDSTELTLDRMTNQWRELERVLTRMVNDETWRLQPDPKRCPRCPYFNTECFPFPAQEPSNVGPSE